MEELKRQSSANIPPIYPFGELTSEELLLPKYTFDDKTIVVDGSEQVQHGSRIAEPAFELPFDDIATKDIRAIGANIRTLITDSFDNTVQLTMLNKMAFLSIINLLKQNADDEGYRKSLAHMLRVENALREAADLSVIEDLGAESAYPLFIWYLVMNLQVEEMPLLEKVPTPVPQEPAEPAQSET